MLYTGVSLKEFIIRSKQDKYKMVKRSDSNDLNLRL